MTPATQVTKVKAPQKKAAPSAGRKVRTVREALERTNKKFNRALAKLAK